MTPVNNEIAYRAIREVMSGGRRADSFRCEEIAFERLRLALMDSTLSAADRAVRLRHALRYADLALHASGGAKHGLPLPGANGWPAIDICKEFGLQIRAGGLVEAEPWRPAWLADVAEKGVDATSAKGAARQWTNIPPAADPWVTRNLGFEYYRGPGQALAVRSALHMPSDETLLVLLPTGEGKSLVFQALACAYPEQTVAVVVPTVALALDHAAALSNCPALLPEQAHAYVGGQIADNELIRTAITNGRQGLVFAAPEAMVSGLKPALLKAAQDGCLAALLIDEAHLVDAWGTDFRSEFQLLSALVAELRNVAPANRKPRIICLSATVTQEALETLETLFSPGKPISIVPAARLRPEPDIWIAAVCTYEERKHRVIEALRHLPRPAVLYVTEQREAEQWRGILREVGFARFKMVHGGTPTAERKIVIDSWRKGELDLVVGTSAFGLGIDFPHVRTVIHACVPESLDRYYQEIGRSGRDNCASIALLMPAVSDFQVAESLAMKRIITVEKGLSRWIAMFDNKVREESTQHRFLLDVTTSPGYEPDMKSGRNEDWNARVLTLMSRAGLIRLSGMRYDSEKKRDLISIDLLDDGHTAPATWLRRVEPIRSRSLAAYRASYQGMQNLITEKKCPANLFCSLYTLTHGEHAWTVVPACGGCLECRAARNEGWFAEWPSAPPAPWPIGFMHGRLQACLDEGRCFIERDTETFDKTRQRRRLKEVVDGLWDTGLRKCIVLGDAPEILHEALSNRPWCVAKSHQQKILSSNGLPPGPEFVWISQTCMPGAHHFQPLQNARGRIFFLPREPEDPAYPGRMLAERRVIIPFDKFHDRLIP